MAAVCFKRLRLLLRHVFHADDTGKGISISEVSSIVSDVRQARLFVQACVDAPQGTANDRRFVQACAKAMTLYKECDEVNAILKAVKKYKTDTAICFHMNTTVINTLSFKLHLHFDTPFEYIQRRIWAKKLPEVDYDGCVISGPIQRRIWPKKLPEVENGGCVISRPHDENNMANILIDMEIDMEIDKELRIMPLPIPPLFNAYQILQLQSCVQQLHYMCLQLPEELSRAVCTGIYADYTISPNFSPNRFVYVYQGEYLCEIVQHLADKALECGIAIDQYSAFWIYCHLNHILSEWEAESLDSDDSILHDLWRFPEIDQNVIGKFQAMIRHANWNKGDTLCVSVD